MKKLILSLVLASAAIIPALAQDSAESTKPIWDHGDNISSITYQNVQIYRVYDQKDAYIVTYARQGVKVGQVTVPKKWTEVQPRKLNFREVPKGIDPYMTIIKQDGDFLKVYLNLPTNRFNPVWGAAPAGMQVDASAETLEMKY